MAPTTVHLPDGQTYTVSPVFSGYFFKSNELNTHPTPFPAGWTVVLHTEDSQLPPAQKPNASGLDADADNDADDDAAAAAPDSHVQRYRGPTLGSDTVFISSLSNPSSSDFKPAASPSRQIAMMLWVTLYWYFHQDEPSRRLDTPSASATAPEGRPKGEWAIKVKRDGVLRGRNLIPKLERMGLIVSHDSAVSLNDDSAWDNMYVSRRMFWQIPSGLFLFTLQPLKPGRMSYPGSPVASRPTSPVRNDASSPYRHVATSSNSSNLRVELLGEALGEVASSSYGAPASEMPVGPYFSSSHLPTFFPPAPLQYTVTNSTRHPVRPRPPRMGEIFYTRFVHSVGKYLSFRVASLSPRPVPSLGPVGRSAERQHPHLMSLSDTDLIHRWLSVPRVSKFWGGPQPEFLRNALESKHSFPAIAMWDGVPFGFFEIYWVREDVLGQQLGGDAADFDRGLHVLIGEEWARGKLHVWMSSLVHWCLQADNRTTSVYLEPRVDNVKFIRRLQEVGFSVDREVSFPHKQSKVCRMRRDTWDGPSL